MKLRRLNSNRAVRLLAAFSILAVCDGTSVAGPLAKTDPPKPLPENIVTAWKKAGASAGWMRTRGFPENETSWGSFHGEETGSPGDLPAFRIQGKSWQAGRSGEPSRPGFPLRA